MTYDDFIILEVGADCGVAHGRSGRGGSGGVRAGTMTAEEILVAKPRDVTVGDYVKIETVVGAKDAADASRDRRKLVARAMPISIITPLSADEAGLHPTEALSEATAAHQSWGIAEILGARPRDLSGKGVKVAVLDTGIDAAHPAFAEIRETIVSHRRNFATGSADDVNGHGTHCAGTIFGRDVDGVRIGVAKGITDVLIGKVLGDDGFGSTKAILDALKWAHTEGANIVSMSLGFDFGKMQRELMEEGLPPELATSITLKAYRDNLRQFETLASLLMQETDEHPGTILVAAAGNESRRHQNPDFVIDVGIPAAAALDMMSVGAGVLASDGQMDVAPFSNINPKVAAPGANVVSAKAGGGLLAQSGTSMAAPHVAGIAALLWEWIASRDGGYVRAGNVRAQIEATARHDRFREKWTYVDRGAGCVLAPQLPK